MTGFAGFLGEMRPDPDEGKTLEQVFAGSLRPDKPEVPFDADEQVANLLAQGYRPGQLSDLSRQLADAQAELAAVEEQNAKAVRRQQRVAEDHRLGRITAFDIANMRDLDEPDAHRAAVLARRCERLRQQVTDASMAIAPAPRIEDPLESASRRAHEAFLEATRAQLAAVEQGRPVRRERPPFASGDEHTGPDCPVCAAAGGSPAGAGAGPGEVSRSAATAAVTLPARECVYVHERGRRDGRPHVGRCVPAAG
jgi:hypothetical protein